MKDKTNSHSRMNWKIIAGNLREAREQLQEIEQRIQKKNYSEVELYIDLQHAYHHLNFAWNARTVRTREYTRMTDADFNKWSQFPEDIEAFEVSQEDKK